MMRIDKILEQWATIYKPLSHSSDKNDKHKTFYRIDAITAENEFVRNINTAVSPCMAFSTLIDAQATNKDIKAVSYLYTIYFMSKQQSGGVGRNFKSDDDSAFDCKVDLDEMAQDLFAFLSELRKAACNNQAVFAIKTPSASDIADSINDETDKNPIFAITSDIRQGLRGMDLSSVRWGTLPMLKNGWWVLSFQFEVMEPRQLCIVESRYK